MDRQQALHFPFIRRPKGGLLPALVHERLLGLALLLIFAGAADRGLASSSDPDTTRVGPSASAFEPEAGRLLRRYVGPDAYGATRQNWDAVQERLRERLRAETSPGAESQSASIEEATGPSELERAARQAVHQREQDSGGGTVFTEQARTNDGVAVS